MSVTIEEIKEILERGIDDNKVYEYELNKVIDDEYHQKYFIGITYQGNVYHWFEWVEYYSKEEGQENHISFSMKETYSRNTGVTKKGLMHRMKVARSMNKRLKTEIFY